jgi:hypothetical protein
MRAHPKAITIGLGKALAPGTHAVRGVRNSDLLAPLVHWGAGQGAAIDAARQSEMHESEGRRDVEERS